MREMTDFCTELLGTSEGGKTMVFAPTNGQVVDVTTERFIYQVGDGVDAKYNVVFYVSKCFVSGSVTGRIGVSTSV